MPPLLVEIGIGLAMAGLFTLIRVALIPWTGERAPFSLVYLAVVAATVLAGWRSGLLALAAGQSLVLFLVIEPAWSVKLLEGQSAASLAVSTTAELLILLIIALYQREVALAWSKRESQFDLLEKALREIDHRTINNYQTVLALVTAQARSAGDDRVRDALRQVADRIGAIANASRKLAVTSQSLDDVRIAEHLGDLCRQIELGLARPGIRLDCEFEEMTLGADETVCVSIIVNELVTNALKHAYPDGRTGTIRVSLERKRGAVELVVEDDGAGMSASPSSQGTGLGSRLVETFVRQLKARHEVTSGDSGTRHRIRISNQKA